MKPRITWLPAEQWRRDNQAWGRGRSHLYFVQQGDGPVKVGVAGHPIRRLSSLQCGNPNRLYLRCVFIGERPGDAFIAEKAVLARFKDRLLFGEWMDVTPAEIMEFISEFEPS